MPTFIDQFEAARLAGTPLISLTAADPADVLAQLKAAKRWGMPKPGDVPTLFQWDSAAGLRAFDEGGAKILASFSSDPAELTSVTRDATAMLNLLQRLPADCVVFAFNLTPLLSDHATAQAAWNLRDPFKSNGRCLAVVGPVGRLPVELEHDFMTFDVPLPDDEMLGTMVTNQLASLDLDKKVSKADVKRSVDATRGLSGFEAEQVFTMSLTAKGIDFPMLWTRKDAAVEQTQGLSVDHGTETLEQMGGHGQLAWYGGRLFKGPQPPVVLVRVDELEKKFAGLGVKGGPGDNTGATQDALDMTLEYMEDYDWTGLILAGPAGTGKTLFSRALGNSNSRRTYVMDYGAMKTKELGGSEAAVRAVMKRILAVAGKGGAYFIATVNALDNIPAPLLRRFADGIWFMDLPTRDEQEQIWGIQASRYGIRSIVSSELPDYTNWTGAEIRNCCRAAYRLGCSLKEASRLIVPIAQSDPEGLRKLRELAKGRLLSTSYEGSYQGPDYQPAQPTAGRRVVVKGGTR